MAISKKQEVKSKRPKDAQSSVALPSSANYRAKGDKKEKAKAVPSRSKINISNLKTILSENTQTASRLMPQGKSRIIPSPQPRSEIQKSDKLKLPAKEKKPFIDSYDIPASYNSTHLTLIARGPHWIYAYWEISPMFIEKVKADIGGGEFARSSYVLRMYDVTYKDFNGENANHSFDLDVGPHSNNWYINILGDNVTYCGEIGMRTPEGRFHSFARSNFVTTPRLDSSSRNDMVWMEVKKELQEEPAIFADHNLQAFTMLTQGRGARKIGRKIFLTDDDIRAYYSKLFPVLSRLISAKGGRLPGYISIEGADILIEDILTGGLPGKEFIKKIKIGLSEESILKGGASESLNKPGASEREKKERKFFFNIGCELIVYGRTEPDAEVWLGDKKIKLYKDGTFSLRLSLPDGKIPLEFVAISKDKIQRRAIRTSVERAETKTEEQG
ncbi:MAG: DUF4912 domain-containing protein [Candidatus Omnitrophota bacterium]